MAGMKRFVVTINNIELTPEQVEAFKFFMRHYKNVAIMREKGFFLMRNGLLAVHFDQNGAISSIVKTERVY